ncbi:MAG TPA: hypothetical protein VJH67_03375 [Candidatus Paceibacterota bacterium]
MQIRRVYIGGWFQRTTLHLSEIYDFLREGYSNLELDKKKLKELQQNLDIQSTELKVDGLEHIELTSTNGISLKIHEDGLIVLRHDYGQGDDLAADIKILTEYYEKKLSPAFSYIFSLGAPVPKELANIKTVYPYFVVVEHATREEITALMDSFHEKTYFEVTGDRFDLFRGDKFYIVHIKKEDLGHSERFIEEQIFLREFKGQLHRYLNLHRIIWERIAKVKEQGNIKGGEIGGFRDKVQGYAKTINLIEARINQMGTYLHTRERIVKSDDELKGFLTLLEYRYETLGDTLAYLQQIWVMTKNYVNSALDLFSSLEAQATQNSVKNLTVVTSMGVGATLIGLFTTNSIPQFTMFGVGYFVALAAIGYFANKITTWFYKRKAYNISDIEYDKDIK